MIIQQKTDNLTEVADVIAAGGVIAFRTDTFYGLGAHPFSSKAVQKIRDLKVSDDNKPILVVISDAAQVDWLIANRSSNFDQLIKKFWPGPLTVIGEAVARLPVELTTATKTVGLRLPNDYQVRELIAACGGALTATSANLSGQAPARNALDVEKYFGDRLDLIVDGGPSRSEAPSTVVDVTTGEIKLIREGLIPWSTIRPN